MCAMEKTNQMTCQITFIPMNQQEPVAAVAEVLKIMETKNVKMEVGEVATLVQGTPTQLYPLLQQIHESMDQRGVSFSLHIMTSNVCGCKKQD